MNSDVQPDGSWGALAELAPAAQVEEMRKRFEALADRDQPARERQAQEMILSEYLLGDEQLGNFTESRLRVWIAMAQANLERTQIIANAYEKAFERVQGAIALRRTAIVQMVARERLSSSDIDVLFELIPNLVRHLPRASQEAVERAAHVERLAAAAARESGARSKPWWKLW